MERLRQSLASAIIILAASACDDGDGVSAADAMAANDAGILVDAAAFDDADLARHVLQPDGARVYPGWYTHDVAGELDAFSTVLERAPSVAFTFHDWNAAGPGGTLELQTFDAPLEGSGDRTVLEMATQLAEEGAILAVAWDAIGYVAEEPSYWEGTLQLAVSFDDIIQGRHDDYIRACARQVKAMGHPIMLSPFSETNSTFWFMFGADELTPIYAVDDLTGQYGDPAIPDGPERMRDGFRHVVDIFRAEEVTNVTWFQYAATGYMNPAFLDAEEIGVLDGAHPRHAYPGDDYVDWIGTSLYIEAGLEDDFNTQFELGHAAWRTVTDKPFFAPEFGVVAVNGQGRGPTIEALVDRLPEAGVQLAAFADSALYALIFDIPRLADEPAAAAAWRAIFGDPRYSTTLRFGSPD